MLDFVDVNYLAIFVAAVAGMGVGFLWYSNVLFAKAWTKLATPNMDENASNTALYLLNFVVYLVIAFALSQLILNFGLTGLLGGLAAGAFAFFGFAGSAAFTENLFSGRSWKLYLINYGYQLVNLLVMGAIISLWR